MSRFAPQVRDFMVWLSQQGDADDIVQSLRVPPKPSIFDEKKAKQTERSYPA